MAKNDSKTPRTLQDLMRRYDFGAILGLKKNFEIQKKNLYKIENELNNMLNSFIINLSDVLENQSDVSLWFYDYIPTTSNEPYSNWVNKQEHDGDIFYDQSTGRVYQYKYSSDSWIENTDETLISAMATTNVGIDTTSDHERKIYFNQPTPPYESGDWWIKSDGTLFICQLTKTSGDYEEEDFINSANYVATVAVKNNNEITVLKGTVTKISESYVSVTDLATGGSTIIDGGNIKTGTIDASLVTIANNNVQLDKDGIKLNNGAKVIGTNGLMNTYLYENKDFAGFVADYTSGSLNFKKKSILVNLVIPDGLLITKAKVRLIHNPVYWFWNNMDNNQSGYEWGYLRNVKLYKCTNVQTKRFAADFGGQIYNDDDISSYTEIANAFGSSGFTANVPSESNYNAQVAISEDIKNSLSAGLNQLKLETMENIPSSYTNSCRRSAYLTVQVEVEGYMSYTMLESSKNIITEAEEYLKTEDDEFLMTEEEG